MHTEDRARAAVVTVERTRVASALSRDVRRLCSEVPEVGDCIEKVIEERTARRLRKPDLEALDGRERGATLKAPCLHRTG